MLTVTEDAKQLLKQTLQAHTDDPEIGLRLLSGVSGKFEMQLDKEGIADQVVEHDGSKVLLIGPELASLLEEVTIDVQDTADGPRLAIFKK